MNYGILPSFFSSLFFYILCPFLSSLSSLSVGSLPRLCWFARPRLRPRPRHTGSSSWSPATRVSRLCSSYNCARGAYSRARLARTSESFFVPPSCRLLCSEKAATVRWRRWRRQRRGKDRKTEGSRESKSSGYIAALDRLSLSFSFSRSFSRERYYFLRRRTREPHRLIVLRTPRAGAPWPPPPL